MTNTAYGPRLHYGAPVDGADEVQTITVSGSPTGGTFKLRFGNHVTADIAHNADAAAIDAALEALPNIGAGGVAVTGGGPFTATFGGNLAKKALPLMELYENSLEGDGDEDVALAEDTPGVTATERGAPTGALLVDTQNGKLYINTGTALEPTWTVVGAQTA